jgi:hypothetical protein
MIAEWKDTTSYRVGERGNLAPRSWTLSGNLVRINVHRYLHSKSGWYVTCQQVNIDSYCLNEPLLEDAKREAVTLVRDKLRRISDELEALKGGKA